MEYDSYDNDDDIYHDINNITALISVFMQKALESASYYTIQSGRKIVSSKDISMALKREMFIFMERDDIEEKTNEILDEIEVEQQIKDNLNDEDLEKFEDLEKDEIKEIEDDFIIDDEDMQEEWVVCNSDDEICVEMNFYNEKFDSFEPSNNFEKLVYNSILNIDKQFNL
jgi:hypothetical protein